MAPSLSFRRICAAAAVSCAALCALLLLAHAPATVELSDWHHVDQDNWGNIKADYALCRTGKEQSPVDVVPSKAKFNRALKALTWEVSGSRGAKVVYNHHAVQVEGLAQTAQLHFGGKTWTLAQLHFHSPSENAVNGRQFPLEVHLVHKSGDALLVVGILFEISDDDESELLKPLLAAFPSEEKTSVTAGDFDVEEFLNVIAHSNSATKYFNFKGSLTTPPCTQGVTWILGSAYERVKAATLAKFFGVEGANNRPTQPLFARKVAKSFQ
jgi:carbonic anhydrase